MKEIQNSSSIIFLLGFMGSGKSKTGSRAAKLLGYDFIDLDKYLEKREGKTISQLFEEHGEDYFRRKENEYLRELVEQHQKGMVSVSAESPSYARETPRGRNNSADAAIKPRKGLKPFRGSLMVAVGGGTPCYNNNMAWMLQHGKCIWLKVSEEELFERLKDKREKRPLLRNLTDEGLKEFIKKKLEEREPYYSKATLIVKGDGLKAKELVEKITE